MNTKPPSFNDLDERFSQVQYLTIDADQAGQRVDNYLVARLKGVPRTHVYKLLRKGEVRVNKGRVRAESRLAAGDVVRLPPLKVARREPPKQLSQGLGRLLDQSILFESDGLLVVNKPPGLAVHGGSGVSLGLIEALRQLRPEARYLELVHRLDRDTSGCIMVAKKRSYLRFLQQSLREKTAGAGGITKVYQALVVGAWPVKAHKVDAPLLKLEASGGRERIVKVHPEGKRSLTQFKILQCYQGFTLVEARPITGRTHQIRVHAQYKGCPLLGDEKYGRDDVNEKMRRNGAKRLFLHASALRLCLPDGQEIMVEAPLPGDLQSVLGGLRPEE
ncbi:RluA family pseudouridine synthase [Gilvimarinus sp. DA14]|uniref:RluA family pseudouridine synthase n=1 Tax=Gilvimarinus sp. DA14 TaxID=2956798 RepID=UPI0020B6C689|nr:RluA family pseudouridine synthase [Gilvimarinus sp. DA14]UTF60545.1 RluA family pseudouridine synthase [Gilvimarinus sp. DA14]